jgi:hypothetical protein
MPTWAFLKAFVVTAPGTATFPELYGTALQKPTGSETLVYFGLWAAGVASAQWTVFSTCRNEPF